MSDTDAVTREYDARVARREANASRITHEDWCAYPGEVTDDGTRCTWCGAEAGDTLAAAPAVEDDRPAGLPPQLTALCVAAQAFTSGCGKVDHQALEVETEELDRAELSDVVAALDNVREELHDALTRLAPAVRMQTGPSAATLSMSEALQALSVSGAGVQLRHVSHDLDPTRTED